MPPKPFPTHFLCIPIVTATSRPQLAASLAAFSADVTSPDSFAVPAGAVRPVGTLHLTLGVMSLPLQEGAVDKAVELLRTLSPGKMLSEIRGVTTDTTPSVAKGQEKVGGEQPLFSVTLKGLHSMQSPSKASTLYAPPVDADGVLQRFCEKLKAAFEEAGLMISDKRPLLLHATILNTIYIKGGRSNNQPRGGGGGGGKKREKITIDARGILERYEDQVWMEHVPIEKIAICRMGAKATEDGQDQAYEVEAEIDVGSTT